MANVLERLNFGLHEAMQRDNSVIVLGEDILDPYGGAFKVTRGLSTKFPERVLTTPISEAAITGVATGLALRGFRPVVEIMFGDFVTLIADQLVNHAAKFRWMYNGRVKVPMVVRTPMGGRRGYGPTHSQSLEKMFLGIPGLRVVAPNTLCDPLSLITTAIGDDDPVLFIEHKLLYNRPLLEAGKGDLMDFLVEKQGDDYPTFIIHPSSLPTLTMACYGYNFELALAAANMLLLEHEIFSEIVLFSELSPFHPEPLYRSVGKTRKLITIEEGTQTMGWGAEVIAQVQVKIKEFRSARIGALDLPIGTSKNLEDAILPSVNDVIREALKLSRE